MKSSVINSVNIYYNITSNVLLKHIGAIFHNRVQSVLHLVYFLGLFVSTTDSKQTSWQAHKEKERGRKRKRDLWVRA